MELSIVSALSALFVRILGSIYPLQVLGQKEARKIWKSFKCKQCQSKKIKPKTRNSGGKTNVEL